MPPLLFSGAMNNCCIRMAFCYASIPRVNAMGVWLSNVCNPDPGL